MPCRFSPVHDRAVWGRRWRSVAACGVCGILTLVWFKVDKWEQEKRAATAASSKGVPENAPWR